MNLNNKSQALQSSGLLKKFADSSEGHKSKLTTHE